MPCFSARSSFEGAPTSSGSVLSGPRFFRWIRNRAMGPPMRLASIRPKVAQATPISLAFAIPYSFANRGAQAIDVPCPPMRETVPPIRPTSAG